MKTIIALIIFIVLFVFVFMDELFPFLKKKSNTLKKKSDTLRVAEMKWAKVYDDGFNEIYCGITERGEIVHKCVPKGINDDAISSYYS